MTTIRRWLAVLAGIGLLVTLPSVVAALPAGSNTISAAELLDRIQHSQQVGYSGYAESTGGLALPITSQFTALSDLFGGSTQLRVWWRSDRDWRVDSIGLAGETDLHTEDLGVWSWNYESNTATFTEQPTTPEIRLPSDADLLPPQLARRLLSQASAAEASRLPSARIAGRSAAGLRITPADPVSTIDRVEVWADAGTGLPLRVRVVGKRSGTAITSSFLDVHLGAPPARLTAFTIPDGANLRSGAVQDLATTLDRLGGAAPPPRLAGLGLNALLPNLGSVGVYGRGVTEFVAVPLPLRFGYALHHQLAPAATAQNVAGTSRPDPDGDSLQLTLTSGPLNLLLTAVDKPGGPWLLIGTVGLATLAKAAAELPANPRLP